MGNIAADFVLTFLWTVLMALVCEKCTTQA